MSDGGNTATASIRNRASNDNNEFVPVINKLHTIYPAIGRRSVRNSQFTDADKFYMDHHRTTRHGLYTILEKYLSAYVLSRVSFPYRTHLFGCPVANESGGVMMLT